MHRGLVRLYRASLGRIPGPGVEDIVVMLLSGLRNVLTVGNVTCWLVLRILYADVRVRHPPSVQLLVRVLLNMSDTCTEILLIVTKVVSWHWGSGG